MAHGHLAERGQWVMDLIMEIRFGSHLYGTATLKSDLDFKAVCIPDARDILLQRVRDNIGISPDKEPGERNSPVMSIGVDFH